MSIGQSVIERGQLKGRALASWRAGEAVRLAGQGASYDEIAEHCGWANRGTAWRTVQKALKARQTVEVDTMRALAVERLRRLLPPLWERLDEGDTSVVNTMRKVVMDEAKVLGVLPLCRCQRMTAPTGVVAPKWMLEEWERGQRETGNQEGNEEG